MFRIDKNSIVSSKNFVVEKDDHYIINPPDSFQINAKRVNFLLIEKENLIRDLISGLNKRKIMNKYNITEQNLYRYFYKEFKLKSISEVRKRLRENIKL